VNKVRGSGGVKARELRVWNKDIVMSSTKNQRMECLTRNEDFIIAVCEHRGCSMGRRSWMLRDMQTRDGDLVIADQVRIKRHARHLYTTPANAGHRQLPGRARRRTQEGRGDSGRQVVQIVHGSGGLLED
jgi:hypothetical protein